MADRRRAVLMKRFLYETGIQVVRDLAWAADGWAVGKAAAAVHEVRRGLEGDVRPVLAAVRGQCWSDTQEGGP